MTNKLTKKFIAYKFKNKIMNQFLWDFNIMILVNLENKGKTYNIFSHEIDGKKYNIIILPNVKEKISAANQLLKCHLDETELSDVLFTNLRLNINDKIYISQNLNIYMHYLGKQDKRILILRHYYKIKEIIRKYEIEELLTNYNLYKESNTIDFITKNIKINLDDYCYVGELKKIIKLYKNELSAELELENPKINDAMILKYLENYFSKLIVISYDEDLVKNFLKKYYISDVQSEDKVWNFVNNIIYTYNKLNKTNITYVTRHNFTNHFNCSLAKKYNDKKSANIIDKLFQETYNYNNLLFMYEIIEIKEYHSVKKKIINYITALELLLTHSPKNNDNDTISKQFIFKTYLCLKKMKVSDFTLKELKEIYTYRSKMIHGDYNAINKCIRKLSKMDPYFIPDKILKEEIYNTQFQLVENRLEERVEILFETIFKLFIKNYQYVNDLQQSIIDKKDLVIIL